MHTLHLLPTQPIKLLIEVVQDEEPKLLSKRVDEEPSFTFPTRLTVSRCRNLMNATVSSSNVSFVMVAEAEAAAEPDEPTAPSTIFRRPSRRWTAMTRP